LGFFVLGTFILGMSLLRNHGEAHNN
jgi:hypothetical protein